MTTVLHQIVANATNLAPSTRDKYRRDLDAWVEFAGKSPKGWTRRKAQAFYSHLLQQGLKPQSANRLLSSVHYAARWWAIQEGNPDLNFAIVQKAKPTLTTQKQVLNVDQAIRLLGTCYPQSDPNDARDFALMVTGLETGMRQMSLRSMTFEQCFFRGDTKTGYPTARVMVKGHGNERVPVPLSETAIHAIEYWQHRWLGEKYRRGPVFQAGNKNDGAFEPGGRPLGPSTIWMLIDRRGQRAGIKLSPHVFRHTFVTWRLEAGYTPHEVAAVTHHKLKELGALGSYVSPIVIGEKMRASTPSWLANYVRSRLEI
jgi:integrase/recombinase XerD